jgi:hypothetical protein
MSEFRFGEGEKCALTRILRLPKACRHNLQEWLFSALFDYKLCEGICLALPLLDTIGGLFGDLNGAESPHTWDGDQSQALRDSGAY